MNWIEKRDKTDDFDFEKHAMKIKLIFQKKIKKALQNKVKNFSMKNMAIKKVRE